MAWPCGDIQNIKNELRLNVCYPIFIFKEAIPTITSISSWGYFPSIQRLPFSFPILCFATFLFFSRNDGYQRFISYFSLEVSTTFDRESTCKRKKANEAEREWSDGLFQPVPTILLLYERDARVKAYNTNELWWTFSTKQIMACIWKIHITQA